MAFINKLFKNSTDWNTTSAGILLLVIAGYLLFHNKNWEAPSVPALLGIYLVFGVDLRKKINE